MREKERNKNKHIYYLYFWNLQFVTLTYTPTHTDTKHSQPIWLNCFVEKLFPKHSHQEERNICQSDRRRVDKTSCKLLITRYEKVAVFFVLLYYLYAHILQKLNKKRVLFYFSVIFVITFRFSLLVKIQFLRKL